jgi:hypothetical protein
VGRQFRDIPSDLRRRVKRHYATCWRKSAVPYAELQVRPMRGEHAAAAALRPWQPL